VFPSLIDVEQRGWESISEVDAYDLAVALGVFDYVDDPVALLTRMGRAAPHAVGSFPAPGLRLLLRKVRYGARGVGVHGYRAGGFDALAAASGLEVAEIHPLGRAGFVAHFRRPSSAP
jgi:hypothetical protein